MCVCAAVPPWPNSFHPHSSPPSFLPTMTEVDLVKQRKMQELEAYKREQVGAGGAALRSHANAGVRGGVGGLCVCVCIGWAALVRCAVDS